MKKLKKKFPKIDQRVVEYVFHIVCGDNTQLAQETLENLGTNDILQIKKSIEDQEKQQQKHEKKEEVEDENFPELPGIFDKTNKEHVLLEKVDYHIDVNEIIASTVTTQLYVNKKESPVEMVYNFAYDENSALHSVVIELYDPKTEKKKVLKCKAKDKEKADENYDDKIAEGNTAILMKKNEKNADLVKLNLGNVQPSVEVKVIMSSLRPVKIEKIEHTNNVRFHVVIPSMYNVKEEAEEMKMEKGISGKVLKNVAVSGKFTFLNGKIMKISSENPGIEVKENTFESTELLSSSEDIVVVAEVEDYPLINCVFQKTQKDDKYKYVTMASIIPTSSQNKEDEDEEKLLSELIIIVDCSGSMSGSRIKYARQTMELMLKSLDPESQVKLNIVRFGTNHDSLFRKPEEFTEDTFRKAMKYVKETKSNMRQTDIYSPVRNVLNKEISKNYNRQVFLITDGEDDNVLRIINLVKSNCKSTRIFSCGIGRECNSYFIREIAKSSNGQHCFLTKSDEIKPKIMKQLEYALKPSIHNISFQFDEKEFGETKNVHLFVPTVYQNQSFFTFILSEKYPTEEQEIKISYEIGEHKEEVSAKPTELKIPTNDVEVMAANQRINNLQKFGKDKKVDLVEIKEIALNNNLMSSQTSFIVSAENETEVDKEMVVENIPNIPYFEVKEDDKKFSSDMTLSDAKMLLESNYSSGGQERYRSMAPMYHKYMERESLGDRINMQLSSQNEQLSSCSAPRSAGFNLFGGIGSLLGNIGDGIGKIFKKKKRSEKIMMSESALNMEEEYKSYMPEGVEYDKDNVKKYLPANLALPEPLPEPEPDYEIMNESIPVTEGDLKLDDGEDKFEEPKEKKKEEVKKKKEVDLSGVQGTMNRLLHVVSLNGLWECNKQNASLIGMSLEEIEKVFPGEKKEDFENLKVMWITALIVQYLRTKFAESQVEWKLIVKKSERFIKKNKAGYLLELASKIVE